MIPRIIQSLMIALLIMIVVGCQDDTVLDPTANSSSDQGNSAFQSAVIRNPIITIPLAPAPVSERDIQLVLLPEPAVKIVRLPMAQHFSADSGGVLICKDEYMDDAGNPVERFAKLYIPPYALTHDADISMMLDTSALGVMFEPSGLFFNKALIFTFEVQGIKDLGSAGPLKFYFVDDQNRTFVPIPSDRLSVDSLKGTLQLDGAKISHFSRYGFGR